MYKPLPRVSSAGMWTKCPASFKAQQQFPKLDNELHPAVIEGRLCHDMIEMIKAGITPTIGALNEKHGIVQTRELVEIAYKVWEIIPDGAFHEHKITMDNVYPGLYGYCDAYIVDQGLDVYDQKFGYTYVEVEENPQLILYALGLIAQYGLTSDAEVRLHILQPRSYGYPLQRTWVTTVGELLNYVGMFTTAIENALSTVPTATTGSHCKYCSARANCSALRDVSIDVVDLTKSLSTNNVTGDQIGIDLPIIEQALERLTFMRDALTEQALHKIKNGENVRGYILDVEQGREGWQVGTEEQVKQLGQLFGVSVVKESLITPKQLSDLGIDKVVISNYTARASSMKLKQQTAKDIAKLFNI